MKTVAQRQYVVSDTHFSTLQGSGPEGDAVLLNTGGVSFVLPEKVDEMLKRAFKSLKAFPMLIQGLRKLARLILSLQGLI